MRLGEPQTLTTQKQSEDHAACIAKSSPVRMSQIRAMLVDWVHPFRVDQDVTIAGKSSERCTSQLTKASLVGSTIPIPAANHSRQPRPRLFDEGVAGKEDKRW